MHAGCSWCLGQKEAVPGKARAPLGHERNTSGICATHRRGLPTGRSVRMLERRGRL
jgi:hypothetical protein